MKLRDFLIVVAYLILHLFASGPMNYLMYLNNTRDFYDVPIALSVGTTYKMIIAIIFLRVQKVEVTYILPIIILGLITRILFHGPFPFAVIAGWLYLYTRNNGQY